MNFNELKTKGLIEKYRVSTDEIRAILEAASSDLKTARDLLNTDICWAFNIAYNSILETGIALMYARGYRPTGEAKHVSVILFLRKALGREYEDKLNRFNQMRRRRNKAVYGILRDITEYEAKSSVEFAIELTRDIMAHIKSNGTNK
jgi:uncharacterized protein (UPF0332 family)